MIFGFILVLDCHRYGFHKNRGWSWALLGLAFVSLESLDVKSKIFSITLKIFVFYDISFNFDPI